ncbi:MAG TPA: hypothetical protein VH834_05490 [Solirubrobacteraceae bacterium]
MDEIFRFLFLRPPDVGSAVTVTPSQDFGKQLAAADTANDRKAAFKRAAGALVGSARGLQSIDELAVGAGLTAVAAALEADEAPDRNDLVDAVEAQFGMGPVDLVKDDRFAADKERLADNLIAAKLLSSDGAVTARRLESLLRLMTLIERVADDDPHVQEPGAVAVALARPTTLGAAMRAPMRDLPPGEPPNPPPPKPDDDLDGMRERIALLERVAGTLRAVEPRALNVPAPDPVKPQDGEDPTTILRSRVVRQIREAESPDIELGNVQAVAAELKSVESAEALLDLSREATPRLLMRPEAVKELPDSHRAVLQDFGLDLTRTPLPSALQAIEGELVVLNGKLVTAETKTTGYTQIGSQIYDIGRLTREVVSSASVPTTHGEIKPVGVGDLLVVRQHLKRYEGGEIGHIENILKGEFKKRRHTRSQTTEETVTTEDETTRDEEHDSQTTERFELQREASDVIKDDVSFKAGVSVSGSYGPTVEFKASTDFAMDHAKEEATKTASTYSKEVVERASTKVSERHREERILRTLEFFEEVNNHGVDNTGGDGDVIGVYQWVDKVYEAQVFNYGKRMMFDLMVPEPAAFWIYANTNKPRAGADVVRPDRFTLRPQDLNPYNYGTYVQKYEVAGVKPPPEPYTTVAKTFDGVATHDDHGATKVGELPIPDGYQAISGHAVANANNWTDWNSNWMIQVAIGKDNWYRQPGSFVDNYYTLDNEEGAVSVAILAFGIHYWIVGVEVDCQLTPRAYAAWQLETHAAIQQAYLKLERDYQDQIAALEVQAASQVQGRNPLENAMLERAELKKQAIEIFTAQHFDLFGAIEYSAQGYPQPWLSEADLEGRYIRFFEQAFEWEQMMYLYYPYFWGRKDNWPTQALLQDVDPQFAEFLKAGAARVVVPVRPGFEAAVAHFLDTGEIWQGADPPTLTSPLYVSIIDEIKERTQAPGTEVAQGDPWDVRLPTTLVRLRPDGSLPSWTKQADGSWTAD